MEAYSTEQAPILADAMSLNIVRRFCHWPSFGISLARPCCQRHRLFLRSETFAPGRHLTIRSFTPALFWKSSIERSSRTFETYASLTKSAQRTSWDEAADAYFSEGREKGSSKDGSAAREREGERRNGGADGGRFPDAKYGSRQLQPGARDSSGADSWEQREKKAFVRRRKASTSSSRSDGVSTSREAPSSSGRELKASYGGVRKWGTNREREDFVRNSGGYEGDRNGRTAQWQKPASVDREQRDFEQKSGNGGNKNGTGQRQKPNRVYRPREDRAYNSRSGSDYETRGKIADRSRSEENSRGWDGSFGDDRRWQAREYFPPLQVEGQALYGVAPIICALQVSRRTFYCLYMQENLLQNIENGKRKDKTAVSFVEEKMKSMGVTIKETSKHDLNMLVDNRPHQGLVLDASPLEMVPVEMLEAPIYQDRKPPVWVALDEVTDPQNFGAILRSAYFLGAEGVVVCAKNSAPLSGVVSKASSGAMEVMEVQFCKNMMKFLSECKENGWRVVGASAESSSVPVRELPRGIATVLVLGNEGRGLRTNVKRACDQLISIAGVSKGRQQQKADFTSNFVAPDFEESELEEEEVEEDGVRRGAELSLVSAPVAVDSLNVSVAAGIMLYELTGSPVENIPSLLSTQNSEPQR